MSRNNAWRSMRGIPFSVLAILALFKVVKRMRLLFGALALFTIWRSSRANEQLRRPTNNAALEQSQA